MKKETIQLLKESSSFVRDAAVKNLATLSHFLINKETDNPWYEICKSMSAYLIEFIEKHDECERKAAENKGILTITFDIPRDLCEKLEDLYRKSKHKTIDECLCGILSNVIHNAEVFEAIAYPKK